MGEPSVRELKDTESLYLFLADQAVGTFSLASRLCSSATWLLFLWEVRTELSRNKKRMTMVRVHDVEKSKEQMHILTTFSRRLLFNYESRLVFLDSVDMDGYAG